MSNTTVIKSIQVRDISALRDAIAELRESGVNIELAENATPRMYYAHQGKRCAYVVKLPNCQFDVGLDLQEDGSYAPVLDTHANYIHGQIGAACEIASYAERGEHSIGKLMQTYAKHAAINKAIEEGHIVDDCWIDEEGSVQLELSVMG